MDLNEFLQPKDSPIATYRENFIKEIDWDIYHPRNVVSSIHVGSLSGVVFTGTTSYTTGTLDAVTVTGQSILNGTLTNNKTITGGTYNNGTFNTPVINFPTITNAQVSSFQFFTGTIGTALITGGTINPLVYQNGGGTVGASATAVYVKTVNFGGSTVTLGTLGFSNGLLISST